MNYQWPIYILLHSWLQMERIHAHTQPHESMGRHYSITSSSHTCTSDTPLSWVFKYIMGILIAKPAGWRQGIYGEEPLHLALGRTQLQANWQKVLAHVSYMVIHSFFCLLKATIVYFWVIGMRQSWVWMHWIECKWVCLPDNIQCSDTQRPIHKEMLFPVWCAKWQEC